MIHFLSTDNRQRSTVFVQIVNLLFSDVSTTYYLFSLVSSTRLYHNFQFSTFNFQFVRRNNDILFIFKVSLVRLYHNFQFSTFNFQFVRRNNYILFIFKVSLVRLYHNFQFSVFNFQLENIHSTAHRCLM